MEVSTTNTGRRWLADLVGVFADLLARSRWDLGRLAGDAPSLSQRAVQGEGIAPAHRFPRSLICRSCSATSVRCRAWRSRTSSSGSGITSSRRDRSAAGCWPGRTPRSPPRRSSVLRCRTACRASTAGHACRPVRWSDLRVIARLSCKALMSAWCGSKMLTLTTATDSGECNHVASEREFVAARSGAFGGDGDRLEGVVKGEHVE